MRGVAMWPADHPVRVLLCIGLVSALALSALRDPESGGSRLWVDPGMERLLPADDPERAYADRIRHLFQSVEPIVVAVDAPQGVLDLDHLETVEAMALSLEEIPEVRRVVALPRVPHFRMDDDEIDLRPIGETLARFPERAGEVQRAVENHPLVRDTLISVDAKMSALIVTFRELDDRVFLEQGFDLQIRERVDALRGDTAVWISGPPVLKAEISRALVAEFSRSLPLIALLGAFVLAVAFGSVRGVLLPLATIALALLWTASLLALAGRPLNLVTTIVPALLITVGLAYVMHFMSDYAEQCAADHPSEADRVRAALGEVALPIAVAGLTTAGGFCALLVSPLPAIREFGLLASAGILLTVFLCLTFLPAALSLAARFRRSRPAPARALFSSLGEALGNQALRYRGVIIVAGIAALLFALFGITRIEVGSNYIANFDSDKRVRADYEVIRDAFGGANFFQVVIETGPEDALLNPRLLAELETFQTWLEAQPEIGPTISIVDHMRMLNRDLFGENGLPESAEVAKQILFFAGGEGLQRYADSQFRIANVLARARVDDSREIAAMLERVEERVAALPAPFVGRITGDSVLLNRTLERIARGQFWSIAAAFLVIYAILALLFTSARVALLALLPNVIPVAVFFGALGFTGIPLNPTTSLIACIALGIAVDDTTHYMVRFGHAARRLADERLAALRTLREVVRPVTLTSIALCGGFLVMVGSELRNQVQFGALAAFTLAVAWLVDVTLTPAITAGAKVVTFWDVLRLDLGREPQKEIPLFAGLSKRQTRVFALMMDIREIRAGDVLMRQGESGVKDIYAVLEGELEVFSEHDGVEQTIRHAERGDLVGTLGHYAGTRSATVRVLHDARLLRIEERDLDELLRRHPKIAGSIYRNLGHAQTAAALRRFEREYQA